MLFLNMNYKELKAFYEANKQGFTQTKKIELLFKKLLSITRSVKACINQLERWEKRNERTF